MKNSNGRDSAVGPAPLLSTRLRMDETFNRLLIMISDDAVVLGKYCNYMWILQRHPHMLRGCCCSRSELWSLESSSSWAQWFFASCFQLPPLLISDFKITIRKRAHMKEHRRQKALLFLRTLDFIFTNTSQLHLQQQSDRTGCHG